MEYKKSYKFMVYGPVFVALLILILATTIGIVCMLVFGLRQDEANEIVIGIVFIGILLLCLVWLVLEMFLYVSIDEDKIELKGYKGVLVKFNIKDISKIEVIAAYRGDYFLKIFGSPSQNLTKKHFCIKEILLISRQVKKNIRIIKHFIPDTIPWTNRLNAN